MLSVIRSVLGLTVLAGSAVLLSSCAAGGGSGRARPSTGRCCAGPMIAFTWDGPSGAGQPRIGVATPGGRLTETYRLPSLSDTAYLAWSPSSRRLAYVEITTDSWTIALPGTTWVLDTATGRRHVLARNATQPAWSPDGRTIAFVRNGAVWMMDSHGAHQRRVLASAVSPAWSPDGQQIAFTRGGSTDYGDGAEIYIASVDGHNVRRLTHNGVYDNEAAWSPDGTRIAYIRGPGDGNTADTSLNIMRADGSHSYRVWSRTGRNGAHHPSWSPGARRLVFSQSEDDALKIVNADGSGLHTVDSFTLNSSWPVWSS